MVKIETRLKQAPQDFGEPLHGIPGTDLIVMVGFVRPLCVQFSVSELQKRVIVRKLSLMAQ